VVERTEGGGLAGVSDGWHPDPFGRFEERWFAQGQPTQLVRSGGIEAQDAPGSANPTRPQWTPSENDSRGARVGPIGDWDGLTPCPNCGAAPSGDPNDHFCRFCRWPIVRTPAPPQPQLQSTRNTAIVANVTCIKCRTEQQLSRRFTSACVGCGIKGRLVECRACHILTGMWGVGDSILTWTCATCSTLNFAAWETKQKCGCLLHLVHTVPSYPLPYRCPHINPKTSQQCPRSLVRILCGNCGAGNYIWEPEKFEAFDRRTWKCSSCKKRFVFPSASTTR
jgi:hypothetical protein